ncbi:MAG: hypothetical protein UT37_C0004G0031 [Parcubacteria group bacterium GW2011_GWA2_39_18]|nr:MAG: hypothetical protein UT37_C0004G0031 [Parcubacteria group bacterium GW2011_GWA2_39_18]
MWLDKIKQLLKNGLSSAVILENDKPAYVVMEYSFFEKMTLADNRAHKNIEAATSDDAVQNLMLDELEEENADDVLEEKDIKFSLSDLPM